jgi:hypothetical protein
MTKDTRNDLFVSWLSFLYFIKLLYFTNTINQVVMSLTNDAREIHVSIHSPGLGAAGHGDWLDLGETGDKLPCDGRSRSSPSDRGLAGDGWYGINNFLDIKPLDAGN